MSTATAEAAMTMTVRVLDRAAERPWGSGLTTLVVRDVVIDNACPKCGGLRGTPIRGRWHEDGETVYVDHWTNRCGHIDWYVDVLAEGDARAAREALIETLAERVHIAFLGATAAEGVTSRLSEWGEEQIVPFEVLSEQAKEKDRSTVRAVLAALEATGVKLTLAEQVAA